MKIGGGLAIGEREDKEESISVTVNLTVFGAVDRGGELKFGGTGKLAGISVVSGSTTNFLRIVASVMVVRVGKNIGADGFWTAGVVSAVVGGDEEDGGAVGRTGDGSIELGEFVGAGGLDNLGGDSGRG